jgi:hypothetical protein
MDISSASSDSVSAIIDKNNAIYYYSDYCIQKLSSGVNTTIFGKCGTSGTKDGIGTETLFNSVSWMKYSPFYNSIYMGHYNYMAPSSVRSINLETKVVKTLTEDHGFFSSFSRATLQTLHVTLRKCKIKKLFLNVVIRITFI